MAKKSGKKTVKKIMKKAVKNKPAKSAASAVPREIVLKNYMEDIVKRNLDDQLQARSDICGCSRCRMDIFAYSLNHLPPKYVVSGKGHIFTKLQEMEMQFNADVTREVYKAVEFIRTHKRHE
ncbi:MAG: late competence development ComFB family protein [Spirochaetia bacterium]|nr:late competence development ComFB family protein [Spirochaetia bacterium]